MSRLRVELVSEHASPLAALGEADAGGQNVHVAALASHLAGLGCEVTVATRAAAGRPARDRIAPGVTVEHVPAGPAGPLAKDDLWPHMPDFARALRDRWTGRRPDIVHAHFWMSGWAATRAAQALPEPPPVVQTFHALGTVKRRHQGDADSSPPQRGEVETALLQEVDHVVATCWDEVKELVELGGDPGRISVVPCGIDPAEFRPTGPEVPARRYGRHRIVTVSRLVRRKGIDDIIAALPSLPDTELLVAGGPPAGELAGHPEATRLRRLATRLGVADKVVLLGALARRDVPALLRSADVAVCVPWYEPFGIVPLEAMACGVPVVGSAVGGLLDSVADRSTGFLVPPRDPQAVARAVGRLLDNPSLREHMGAEGAARVRQDFTWDQVARSTLTTYDNLLAARSPSPLLRQPDWAVTA